MSNIERTGGAGDIVLNARLAIFTDEDSTINAGDGSLIIRGRIVAVRALLTRYRDRLIGRQASSNPLSPSKLTLEGNTIDVRSADGPGGLGASLRSLGYGEKIHLGAQFSIATTLSSSAATRAAALASMNLSAMSPAL